MRHNQLRLEILVVLVLVALAFFVRVYRLSEIPVGLHFDEAANGVDALDILQGHFPVFFERNNGREPLFIYLQAISVALLGATPFALRVTAAVIGALTVGTTYWMTREAFARAAVSPQRLALWTALFLAFSYWHVTLSRNGYRAISLPLVATIAFALFWRAWRRVSDSRDSMPWATLILCGAFAGLTLYTYTSARFVPVLFAIVAVAALLQARTSQIALRRAASAFGVIALTATIALLPLGFYFLSDPVSFLSHAGETSFLNPEYNQGQPLETLIGSTLRTAGLLGVVADPNLRHNPAGRPAIDLLLAAWVVGGLALAIRRYWDLPYFFTAAWLVIFALPSMLTAEGIPHSLRAVGALPATCILAVLAMLVVGDRLRRRSKLLATWLPLPFLLLSGISGLDAYFSAWDGRAELDEAYDVRFVQAADFFAQPVEEPGRWLLPFWPITAIPGYLANPEQYIQVFLSNKPFSRAYVKLTEDDAAEQFRTTTAGQTYVHVAHWIESPMDASGSYALADWKGLADFVLVKHGARKLTTFSDGSMTATTYQPPAQADYEIATTFAPVDASFGGQVALRQAAYGHTAVQPGEPAAAMEAKWLPSGHAAWAALHWEAQQPVANNQLKVSLFLADDQGHLAGQVDEPLAGDLYLFETTWPPGQVGSSYHILKTLPGIPPGAYQLYAAVYDGQTLQRLPATRPGVPAASAALIGSIEVTRAISTPVVQPQVLLPADTYPQGALGLIGYELPATTFSPGDTIPLTLFWKAREQPDQDYIASVRLQRTDGQVVAETVEPPGGNRFPTSEWQSGDIVRDWHDIVIPPSTPAGAYQLVVSRDAVGAEPGGITLADIEVSGRPRRFTAPIVQYPVTATVGNAIAFLGYTMATDNARPGDTTTLTLHWQALAPMDKSYAVFAHILGPADQVVAQHDSAPGQGSLPTTNWLPGETLDDTHPITLPADLPPDTYRIAIGVYDPISGQRLSIVDASGQAQGDSLVLPQPLEILRP